MFSHCFNVNYPGYEVVSDDVIEAVARYCRELAPRNDWYIGGIDKYIERQTGIDPKLVMRDPRFELITQMRFNPWVLQFELLRDNGHCCALKNSEQCAGRRVAGSRYCNLHSEIQ
jgi:hypothetical protein